MHEAFHSVMSPAVPVFLFLSAGAVSLFSFIAVATWSDNRRREREAYYRSETLKKIAESQAPGVASALELMREQDAKQIRRTREGMKLGGLISIAVGIAIMPFFRAVQPERPVYLLGLVPLLVGVAILIYIYALGPKE